MNETTQYALNIILILGVTSAYLYPQFSNQKIVYVDSNKLLNGCQGMVDARTAYQQKATAWKGNIDTITVEVKDAIKDYEKESVSMTAKEKELSQELI